jgi:hypothetical protein
VGKMYVPGQIVIMILSPSGKVIQVRNYSKKEITRSTNEGEAIFIEI